MNIEQLYSLFKACESISTDTRNIPQDSMFFALKGGNFNGNKFAEQAIEKGAKYAIVDEQEFENENNGIYYVSNGLEALQRLAHHHRKVLDPTIISLTGSNGKTTTKELITRVLQKKYKLISTIGNLNNHIGVPLTLLRMKEEHQFAIVEMGANHLKEIELLCQIAEPDYGYITNFGKAHLEGFGGIEGVIKGKSEMYHYLKNNEKTVFVNDQDEKQIELTKSMNTIRFGTNSRSDFQFNYLESKSAKCPAIEYKSTLIQSDLIGNYNLSNVAVAIAMGLAFDVAIADIKLAIEEYKSGDNRSQILIKNNHEIVLDAYNANPSSMEVALKNFALIEGEKAIILGDMFELGATSEAEHQNIADLAQTLNFERIILIGNHFSQIELKSDSKIVVFKNREDAISYLAKAPIEIKNILIKGSRGMALEKIVDEL